MKKIFTLAITFTALAQAFSQPCTVSGFDACTGNSPVTSFTTGQLVSGTALSKGAAYKFTNVTQGTTVIDAIITVDNIYNATLSDIDDNNAGDETNTPGSHAALFAPRISSNTDLKGTAQRGWVEFTITFYNHFPGNTLPPANTALAPLESLNFLHFDMDGHTVGSNGWFKEIGYVKMPATATTDLINYGSANTELTNGGLVNDASGSWLLTYGSTNERTNVSRCAEVIEKSVFLKPQTSISFRMGYDYKPASPYNNANEGRPVRQYGSKFGCFNLGTVSVLPVSIIKFAAVYSNKVTNITWTTAQEINSSRYEVLRSTDGNNYKAIGTVNSRNSLTEQNYSFQDANIPAGTKNVFYKLAVYDFDGTMRTSNVVAVKIGEKEINKEMSISPNPSSSHAQANFTTGKAGVASIIVYDAAGKVMLQQQSNVNAGKNSVPISNITKLSDGMYTVKITANENIYSSKLIIWK
ncbi:MAG: T9SS type A sorting domain-containing protein [Ferruginibacter sp.]